MKLEYITSRQLIEDSLSLARSIPWGVASRLRGVVGIPRSGLVPAAVIAGAWNLPLISLDGESLHGHRPLRSGGRALLLVDDSIYRGRAMTKAEQMVNRWRSGAVYRAAVYTRSDSIQPDFSCRPVDGRRYFEWNLLGHPDLGRFAFDLDGVVCEDPTVVDDDGPAYGSHIASIRPLNLPVVEVGAIITMRLEKWRSVTEAWLDRHGVSRREVVMCPAESVAARREMDYGRWKGEQALARGLEVFVESCKRQAAQIHRTSGLPCICLPEGTVQCRD